MLSDLIDIIHTIHAVYLKHKSFNQESNDLQVTCESKTMSIF